MPERLDTIPDTGRAILAAPDSEDLARRGAEQEGCDYLLTPYMPTGVLYVIDIDAVWSGLDVPWRSIVR